ncbi:vitamin K epoxide reductase family protein [Gilvibacter sediminis]|uniref:vitamin K epoxide reductase family protein n=1 Tax=Gilvibacter sediminis TaxID=379071 RepID=UPI002350F549|nr:vitamin K epoxide reductase family protein [Gilvibacter sediminis]MDC7997405.1 vitamin K epoxide reductase family protein [Gilvibacter sediminis]
MKEQLYILVNRLIKANGIQLNPEELHLQIMSHPSYPSLHAVTGVLDHFNIPNLALRVPTASEVLEQLPQTFIANMQQETGSDLVFVQKKKQRLICVAGADKKEVLSTAEFLNRWDGIIIAIEKDETQALEYKQPSLLPKIGLVLAGFATLLWFFSQQGSLFTAFYFTLSLCGLAISILIVRHELGLKSTLTEKLCQSGEKTNCDSVLNAASSKLFGRIKLSDLSLVSFGTFSLFTLISLALNISVEGLLIFCCFAGIPMVIYSLYTQAFVVKQWCPLCLGVVAVLGAQAALGAMGGLYGLSIVFSLGSISLMALALTVVYSVWFIVKPQIQQLKKGRQTSILYHKFKRNYSVFTALLQQQKFSPVPEVKNEIVLGNPYARLRLAIVTSPYCFYCKDAHKDLHKILDQAGDQIAVSLRFLVGENKESAMYKIASEVLHVYHTRGQKAVMHLLDALYSTDIDLKAWVDTTNIHCNPAYDSVISNHDHWAREHQINFTPALIVGGYHYPQQYERTDLIGFIEDLKTSQETSGQIPAASA